MIEAKNEKINDILTMFILFTVFQPFLNIFDKKFSVILIIMPLILVYEFYKGGIKYNFKTDLKEPVNQSFIVFIVIILISLIFTADLKNGFIWAIAWINYYAIFIWIAYNTRKISLEKVINTYILVAIIVCSLGIVQYLYIQVLGGWVPFVDYVLKTRVGYVIYGEKLCKLLVEDSGNWFNYTTGIKNFRAVSIFGGPDPNGMFASYFLILAVSLKVNKISNRLINACILVCTVNLLLSFGRAAWISCIISLIVIYVIQIKKEKKQHVKININKNQIYKIILVILAAVAVICINNYISGDLSIFNKLKKVFINMFNFKEQSNFGRLQIFVDNFKLFIRKPILGFGIGSYSITYQNIIAKKESIISYTAHNAYMLFMVECGLLGLIAFIRMYVAPIKIAIGNLYQKNKFENAFFTFIVASTIGVMIHYLFDYDFNNLRFIPLMLINNGLLVQLLRSRRSNNKNEKTDI